MSSADLKLRPAPMGSLGKHSNSSDDAALILEARAGQWQAFAELAHRYDRAILLLARRLTNSDREATDLLQAALLRAYHHLSSYRFQCSFYIWIYRAFACECLEFLRQRSQRTTDATPGKTLDTSLWQLPPRERLVLELKHCFGLKLETIALILETSQTAVSNIFVRAILTLRSGCAAQPDSE